MFLDGGRGEGSLVTQDFKNKCFKYVSLTKIKIQLKQKLKSKEII